MKVCLVYLVFLVYLVWSNRIKYFGLTRLTR